MSQLNQTKIHVLQAAQSPQRLFLLYPSCPMPPQCLHWAWRWRSSCTIHSPQFRTKRSQNIGVDDFGPPKLRETPVFTGFSHRGFSLPKMAAIKIPEFQGPDGIHQDGGIAAAAHGVIAYPPVDRGVSGLDCSISPGQICHRWLAPVGKMDQ